MTTHDIAHLQTLTPDPAKFIRQGRGYVDWKFSQVCAYIGYTAAVEYAQAMRRWASYERAYKGCLLDTTYATFQHHLQTHSHT